MAHLKLPEVGVSAFTINHGKETTSDSFVFPYFDGTITFAPADRREDARLLAFWASMRTTFGSNAPIADTTDMPLFDGLFDNELGDYSVEVIQAATVGEAATLTMRLTSTAGTVPDIIIPIGSLFRINNDLVFAQEEARVDGGSSPRVFTVSVAPVWSPETTPSVERISIAVPPAVTPAGSVQINSVCAVDDGLYAVADSAAADTQYGTNYKLQILADAGSRTTEAAASDWASPVALPGSPTVADWRDDGIVAIASGLKSAGGARHLFVMASRGKTWSTPLPVTSSSVWTAEATSIFAESKELLGLPQGVFQPSFETGTLNIPTFMFTGFRNSSEFNALVQGSDGHWYGRLREEYSYRLQGQTSFRHTPRVETGTWKSPQPYSFAGTWTPAGFQMLPRQDEPLASVLTNITRFLPPRTGGGVLTIPLFENIMAIGANRYYLAELFTDPPRGLRYDLYRDASYLEGRPPVGSDRPPNPAAGPIIAYSQTDDAIYKMKNFTATTGAFGRDYTLTADNAIYRIEDRMEHPVASASDLLVEFLNVEDSELVAGIDVINELTLHWRTMSNESTASNPPGS